MKETLVSHLTRAAYETEIHTKQFPYAINALPEVLRTRWDDPEFAQYRDAFPEEARSSSEAFEAHVKNLTARDIKVAYLKNLQGRSSSFANSLEY